VAIYRPGSGTGRAPPVCLLKLRHLGRDRLETAPPAFRAAWKLRHLKRDSVLFTVLRDYLCWRRCGLLIWPDHSVKRGITGRDLCFGSGGDSWLYIKDKEEED
jgi:hypothetical protein